MSLTQGTVIKPHYILRSLLVRVMQLLESETRRIESIQLPEFSSVQNFVELSDSFRLVHDYRVSKGEIPKHRGSMIFHPTQLLPVHYGWFAHRNKKKTACLGLTFESRFGLPFAAVFPRESQALKGLGLKIAEISGIGVKKDGDADFIWLLAALLRFSLAMKLDELCVVVSPREVEFWHDDLGFQILARTRSMETHVGKTAVLMTFSVKAWREGRKQLTGFLKQILQASRLPELPEPSSIKIGWLEAARLLTKNPDALFTLGCSQLRKFRLAFEKNTTDALANLNVPLT